MSREVIDAARERQRKLGNRLCNTSKADRELICRGLRAILRSSGRDSRRQIAALLTRFSERES
jgi:hypothetical protein